VRIARRGLPATAGSIAVAVADPFGVAGQLYRTFHRLLHALQLLLRETAGFAAGQRACRIAQLAAWSLALHPGALAGFRVHHVAFERLAADLAVVALPAAHVRRAVRPQ